MNAGDSTPLHAKARASSTTGRRQFAVSGAEEMGAIEFTR
jgi:hypothetical protein